MRFTDTKSETLNLRVSPSFKLALREAADHEQRSMVNMLEVLLSEYCERKSIAPANEQAAPSPVHKPARVARRVHVEVAA